MTSRRAFVYGALSSGLTFGLRAADSLGTGIIGVGNRGSLLLTNLIAEPRAKVTAICDIKADRLDRAATAAAASRPATMNDYRRLRTV